MPEDTKYITNSYYLYKLKFLVFYNVYKTLLLRYSDISYQAISLRGWSSFVGFVVAVIVSST